MPTDRADIERVRALDREATSGPWEDIGRESRSGHNFVCDAAKNVVTQCPGVGSSRVEARRGRASIDNAQLVAEYRTLAPRLADRLALALEVVEAARLLHSRWADDQPSGFAEYGEWDDLTAALARFDGRE